MSKPGAQVHLVLELLIDLVVMEISVGKQPVEATHNIMQVLLGVLRNGNSVEVVRVDDCRRVVQVVDHVVDGAAVRGAFVRCANEDEFLVAGHLRAGLRGADAEELDD